MRADGGLFFRAWSPTVRAGSPLSQEPVLPSTVNYSRVGGEGGEEGMEVRSWVENVRDRWRDEEREASRKLDHSVIFFFCPHL